MASLLRVTRGRVERVFITDVRNDTYYAVILDAAGGRIHQPNARPSDALNLGVRVGAPLFASEHLLVELKSVSEEEADRANRRLFEWHSPSAEFLREAHGLV